MKRHSRSVPTATGRSRPVFLFVLMLAATGTLFVRAAEQSTSARTGPRLHDRRLGEEEQIRQREAWFLSTRHQGTQAADELWRLRLRGVEQTKQLIEARRRSLAASEVSGGNFWFAKGPAPSTFGGWAFGNVSGRIQAIAADWTGGVLYVGGGSGGVWRSTNDGLSWESIFDDAGTTAVGAITVDPNDPGVLWVGTGDNIQGCEGYFGIGLLRSADGGVTWEARNGSGGSSLEELASFANVIVDPRTSEHLVVGGRYRGCASGSQQSGGIYTSDDGGLTWTSRLANVQVHEIAQDPAVPDTFWAGTNDGVYKSDDNGVTWVLENDLPNTGVGRVEIAVSPSDPNTVYALFANGPSFWRTTDGGATWEERSNGSDACDGQCWYNMTVRVHRTNPDIVYRGTIRLFKSQDGGASWSSLTTFWGSSQQVHQDMHALLMHPTQPDTVYASGDGGIWKSIDGGATFTNANGNLNVTQFYAIGVDAQDPERICGGAQDNSSLARDGDNVWARQAVTGDGFRCYIDPQDPDRAYITSYPSGGFPNIWRSTTGLFGGFSDISGSASGIAGGDPVNWVTPYVLDPTSPNILYVGTKRVFKSTNHGDSWAQVGPDDLTAGSSSLITLEVNRSFPAVVYSGSVSGRVWRTADAGLNWTDISPGLPERSINDIAGDPTHPDRAFATVGGFNSGHVWEWNLATGWTERSAGLPNVPANTVMMLSGSDIVVGTDTGVFRSFDGGTSWIPWMNGLPEGLVVTDLKFNPAQNILSAGTYGRGAWQALAGEPQPLLILDSIEQPILELDGDGDGNIEPGETWSLRPILRNAGGENAVDVTARLGSSTPGITILEPDTGSFGDIPSGATAAVQGSFSFTVDPGFTCGVEAIFDLKDLTTTNPPGTHADQPGILSATVRDDDPNLVGSNLLDEDFDPAPSGGWSHEAVEAEPVDCPGFTFVDQWTVASRDAAHQNSYHLGVGPGGTYKRANFAWLYQNGKDSTGGGGLFIPEDAVAATLTVEHWYDTTLGEDGGQVAIDPVDNDVDAFITLTPDGGYPGSPLAVGNCNALEGQDAFQGSSGGWITSTFDLMPYKGGTVWLAFVFGSDRNATGAGEGWYVDDISLDIQQPGPPLCDVSPWPGIVPPSVLFERVDASTISATWGDSCNLATFPMQTYAIHAGGLDGLRAGAGYDHAPLDDLCARTSGSSFSPGPGNEYYLVVPVGGGREGGAGTDSTGTGRPLGSGSCGLQRVACP